MSTTYVTTGFGHTTTLIRRALGFFEKCLGILYEWHQRNALRGAMHDLSDRELADIGTSRSEIEYVIRSCLVDSPSSDCKLLPVHSQKPTVRQDMEVVSHASEATLAVACPRVGSSTKS